MENGFEQEQAKKNAHDATVHANSSTSIGLSLSNNSSSEDLSRWHLPYNTRPADVGQQHQVMCFKFTNQLHAIIRETFEIWLGLILQLVELASRTVQEASHSVTKALVAVNGTVTEATECTKNTAKLLSMVGGLVLVLFTVKYYIAVYNRIDEAGPQPG